MAGQVGRAGVVALVVVAASWGAGGALAAATAHGGGLDPGFGRHGTVLTPLVAGSFADGVAVEPGGKIVAVGVTQSPNASYGVFAVTRYTPKGKLDGSFGRYGKVTTDFGLGGTSQADAVAVQGDGKIVVAGYAEDAAGNYYWALARYLPDGFLDPKFGTGGKVTTTFGPGTGASYDFADAVTIEPDGKIVVAGEASPSGTDAGKDFGVAVYNSNGSLDTGFGTGGKVVTDFGYGYAAANGVALSGSDIIAAGYTQTASSGFDAALAAYNDVTGALDPSFGTGGTADVDFGPGDDFAHAVTISGGHIVIAGSATDATQDFAVAELTTSGQLVPGFGNGGLVTIDFSGGADTASGVGIDSHGDIVVAGDSQGSHDQFAIARLRPSGSLDASFGNQGKVTTPATRFSSSLASQDDAGAFAVALQPNNDIVAAGYAGDTTQDFALARYLPGG